MVLTGEGAHRMRIQLHEAAQARRAATKKKQDVAGLQAAVHESRDSLPPSASRESMQLPSGVSP